MDTITRTHNNPPEAISDLELMLDPALVRDQILADYARLFERRDELLAGVERFFADKKTIETIEQQERTTDFSKQIDLLIKDIEKARSQEVKPLDDAKKAIQKAMKAEAMDVLEGAKRDVDAKLAVFLRKLEAERKAQVEEDRRAAQALADAALAKAVESNRPSLFEEAAKLQARAEKEPARAAAPVIARGQGATSSLRRGWAFREVDLALVPVEYVALNENAVRQAIAAGVRSIPGLEIFETDKAIVR